MRVIALNNPPLLDIAKTMALAHINSTPPNQVIRRQSVPYMERWMLSRNAAVPKWIADIGHQGDRDNLDRIFSPIANLFLQRYTRADEEDIHDHPWDNVSLVLCGRYLEETEAGTYERRQGDIVFREAGDRHALRMVEPGTVTLFGTGMKRREWGFYPMVDDAPSFVHHINYIRGRRA